jgi:hypothetical protein
MVEQDFILAIAPNIKNSDADVRKDALCLVSKLLVSGNVSKGSLVSSLERALLAFMGMDLTSSILEQVNSEYPDIIYYALLCLGALVKLGIGFDSWIFV